MYTNEPDKIIKTTPMYIHIKAKNVAGILNRIAHLMRKRKYNMEEVSVSFDHDNLAHIGIVIDANNLDGQQVANQIDKLYDVFEVSIMPQVQDEIYIAYYIYDYEYCQSKDIKHDPINIIKKKNQTIGVFMIPITESYSFTDLLNQNGCKYKRRLLSLV